MKECEEQILDEPAAEKFCAGITKVFKLGSTEEISAAFSVVKRWLNHKVDRDTLVNIVLRIFSGMAYIKAGVAPFLWKGEPTTALMYVTGVRESYVLKGRPMLALEMKCLQGPPAGLNFHISLGRNLLEYIQGKFLGLSFKKYNSPAEHIAGCYFLCTVVEDITGPRLSDFNATDSIKKMNRALAEQRLSLTKCSTAQIECAQCKKSRKECKLAVWLSCIS